MLTNLYIKDFAIIDQLDIEIAAGMISMTGETGAGKSILIDALGLVLGDRAEPNKVIRPGCADTEITASFQIDALHGLKTWLEEQDFASHSECILRRMIKRDGRSKSYLNGHPVNLQTLRAVGEQLVDIHGQHEHQSLLKKTSQRQYLDSYGRYQDVLQTVEADYMAWKEVRESLAELETKDHSRRERLALLRFQIDELSKLNLEKDEWLAINEEHKRLAHAQQLLSVTQTALATLYEQDEETVYATLNQQLNQLQPLSKLDPNLQTVIDCLQAALIDIEETSAGLKQYLDTVHIDPERLLQIEERMQSIHSISRKYQTQPEALPELYLTLEHECKQLQHDDDHLNELKNRLHQYQQAYIESASMLHKKRVTCALELSKKISQAMPALGMEGGNFQIEVNEQTEKFSVFGSDHVTFKVSANPGQPLQCLNDVASGGELSRISLAIQMISTHGSAIPTLIFDEVDAGIGGGVAETVGKHLRALSQSKQVICVTHLPQVAAQAHCHMKVEKQKLQDSTTTRIYVLDAGERTDEIARMLGGINITEQTRRHAQEMLDQVNADMV